MVCCDNGSNGSHKMLQYPLNWVRYTLGHQGYDEPGHFCSQWASLIVYNAALAYFIYRKTGTCEEGQYSVTREITDITSSIATCTQWLCLFFEKAMLKSNSAYIRIWGPSSVYQIERTLWYSMTRSPSWAVVKGHKNIFCEIVLCQSETFCIYQNMGTLLCISDWEDFPIFNDKITILDECEGAQKGFCK